MATASIPLVQKQQEKKKFVRRSSSDGSQRIRRIVQWLFVALNGWESNSFSGFVTVSAAVLDGPCHDPQGPKVGCPSRA